MTSPEHKQKIWNYIKDLKVGMLTTRDDSHLRARPMHIVQNEYDGTLWFFTKKSAEKSYEINKENDICLTFSCPKEGVFISLSGRATLTQDSDLIDQFWSPFAGAWFERGRDDPDVALLEIKVEQGEHWDTEDSMIKQFFELARSNYSEETPDLGENKKFG